MDNLTIQKVHEVALKIAQKFKSSEIELIEILQEVDRLKVHYHYQFSSLFQYATNHLKLSEEVAYIFINVARKSREIPALKEEIKRGAITVSKAKRMTSVITKENQDHWLNLARSSSKNALEKEVARHAPKAIEKERLAYVHPNLEVTEKVTVQSPVPQVTRVQLQVGISESLMLRLRRAQEVLSQKRQRPVSLEEVISEMTSVFLAKSDPLEIAKRQEMRGKLLEVEKSNDTKSDLHVGKDATNQRSAGLEVDLLSKEEQRELCPGTVLGARVSNTDDAAVQADQVGNKIAQDGCTDLLRLNEREEVQVTYKPTTRKPIPAQTRHKIWIKSQGQCTHTSKEGERCTHKRFLQIHHKKHVAAGGGNNLANLELLCSGHHKAEHTC